MILRLVRKSNVDTVELLECMLVLARQGELEDVEATYTRFGIEHHAYTGRYRASIAEALRAAFRMSVTLSHQDRDPRGGP